MFLDEEIVLEWISLFHSYAAENESKVLEKEKMIWFLMWGTEPLSPVLETWDRYHRTAAVPNWSPEELRLSCRHQDGSWSFWNLDPSPGLQMFSDYLMIQSQKLLVQPSPEGFTSRLVLVNVLHFKVVEWWNITFKCSRAKRFSASKPAGFFSRGRSLQ